MHRPNSSIIALDKPKPGALPIALGGALALSVALGIGRFAYTPILPPMAEALRLDRSAAGLIASANFLGYLIGAFVAAMPGFRGSRRFWLAGALAASAITTAAMGLTQNLPIFLLLRFAGGIASAFAFIFASALVLEQLAEAERPDLSPVYFAGVGIGIAVSAALIALLLKAGEGWQSLWLSCGALSLAASAATVVLLRHCPSVSPAPREDAATAYRPGLIRLVVAYGFFGFGYVITATFLVAIVRGMPAVRAYEPVIWVLFGLAAVPSIALWTRLARSIGVQRAFAVACLVEAGGVAASVLWPSATGVILAAILVGGTFMGLTALGMMRAHALATRNPHSALALMTSAFGLGQILGPTFAGVLSDRFGSFTMPSIAAALALVVAAVLAGR